MSLRYSVVSTLTMCTPQSPESQFIFPEGSSHRRGRFELAFSQIGSSVIAGGTVGGLNGFYSGIKETKASQLTGKVRGTQWVAMISAKLSSRNNAEWLTVWLVCQCNWYSGFWNEMIIFEAICSQFWRGEQLQKILYLWTFKWCYGWDNCHLVMSVPQFQ